MRTKTLKAELPVAIFNKLMWLKEKDGFGDRSLNDWLRFLVRDINLKFTFYDQIAQTTRINLLPLWLQNYARNVLYVAYGDNVDIKLPETPLPHSIADLAISDDHFGKNSAIVIGRGPSIWKHKHLELLSSSNYKGKIISTDGMLIDCLRNQITPDLVVNVDGSPIIAKYFADPLVKKHGKKLKVVLSATASPLVYEAVQKVGGQVYWFIPLFDELTHSDSFTSLFRGMGTTKKFPNGAPIMSAGGNSGTASWIIAWNLLKCNPVALIGIDFGYPEGTDPEDMPYFSSVLKHASLYGIKPAFVFKESFKEFTHPHFQTKATADGVFLYYRKLFLRLVLKTPPQLETYNCTEGGTLWGKRIKCMKFKSFLEQYSK